jgi:broad specificity phosphatase PhoE
MPNSNDSNSLVYLIRHARPANLGDAALRYDIPPGPPLSAEGRMQAAMAASWLASACASHPPAVVYTSPLDRTMQTAQVITAQLGVPLALDERLAEHRCDETPEQVSARVREFWIERVTAMPPGCIALVSHGSPIRLMLTPLGDVFTAHPERYTFDYGNMVPHAGIWRARRAVNSDRASQWELDLIFSACAPQMANQQPQTAPHPNV